MRSEELSPSVAQVKEFWETHPLSGAESPFPIGSPKFFDWHDEIRRNDVESFALHMYEFDQHRGELVLDVGCGTGWLCQHFAENGARISGVDITSTGVHLTRARLAMHQLSGDIIQASAEQLPFATNTYSFVSCAGVLHHTPDMAGAIAEIHRVLSPAGRAMISLYYRNWLMSERMWPLTRFFVRRLFARLPDRSKFGTVQTVDDFVRIYDGNNNPLGKAFDDDSVRELFKDFVIEDREIHYFPRRFLPFPGLVPRWLHHLLDVCAGTMVYVTVRKA
jgi:ubiquinone/menaquinone biosynthesis C-methylase UbiE